MKTASLAIYDFDGTMIRGDSIVGFLRLAFRSGVIGVRTLLRAGALGIASRLKLIRPEVAKAKALSFCLRLDPARLRALSEAYAGQLYAEIRPDALRQMKRDRDEGRIVVLLSASTDNYMLPLAERLPADAVICTGIKKLPAGNCRGQEKLRRLTAWLNENGIIPDYQHSSAYADSASDAPILRLTGHSVLVCPTWHTRRKLKRLYPIEYWR